MRFNLQTLSFEDLETRASAPAVIGSDRGLSWRQLREEASRWVEEARELGLAPDMPIVITGHKEAAFFVAMTGALMMRSPFVPVDVIYPAERRDTIARIVGAGWRYDAAESKFIATGGPSRALDEKGLAYVLFTSGSTGEPKGVQIGRESTVLLTQWMSADFGLGDAPVFMNQAPFSFDLSMYEFFGTLSLGGTCVLNARECIASGEDFMTRLADAGVTVWVSTPSFAHQQLLNRRFSAAALPRLSTFLFCGEILPPALCKRLRQRFPEARLLNTYGPTEATVATTAIEVTDELLERYPVLPIGYAKRDSLMQVENGELCIVGDHVMRGYLNRPDLNERKLFVHADGRRGFRTGDRGRVDNDGLLWCDGRGDDQIKLNGYRIELSEISLALQAMPKVEAGICLALRRPDNSVARLLGFVQYAVNNGSAPEAAWVALPQESWKPELEQRLPAYMLPSELISVSGFPMSVNHKIDGRALLEEYTRRLSV